jgi:endoplasmic reticulum junction formation protein lunapark
MPIFSWFAKVRSDCLYYFIFVLLTNVLQKSSEEDYEQVLASLALSIQKRQTQLSEIRLRERRATLLFTFWAFSAWVAYVGLWWAGIVGGRGRAYNGALWGVPVFLGPVV